MLRITQLLLPLMIFVTGCGDKGDQASASNPGENFQTATSVRILEPANGDTVESPFTLGYSAARDVHALQLENPTLGVLTAIELDTSDEGSSGEIVVELDEGHHALTLVGMDEDGTEISTHAISIRVAEEEDSWVTITSPTDGSEVANPVTFAVTASSDVESVEIIADGSGIGEVEPGDTLSHTFAGTGYERTIEAEAWTTEEELVASDAITITVTPETTPETSEFNDYIGDLLAVYPTDGTHQYYWPSGGDWCGTTQDIWYLDTLVAEGDAQGRCYCCGLTWEVYMRAFDELDQATGGDGSLNGLSVDDLTEFRIDWFVRDMWGSGPVEAFDNYGLGERVTDWDDVQTGDLVQFWRYSGSGHSVIFIDWEYDSDDAVIGMYYWSTQSSTEGIAYNSEYFGSSGSSMDPSYFFVARPLMPVDWAPWS